ncbi:MAG: AraC family transcriptional regulator [Bacteroidales bacterium]
MRSLALHFTICFLSFGLTTTLMAKAPLPKIHALYTLETANEFRSSNPDSALIIMDSLWKKATIEGYSDISEINLCYTYGMVCARANQARRSVKFLLQAHTTDSAKINSAFDARICAALSEEYMFLGAYEQALSFALKASEQAKKGKDTEYHATCLAVIGNVYSQMKMYDKAHIYIDRAIAIAQNIENKILYKYVKGDVYSQEGKFKESAHLMQLLINELNTIPSEQIKLTYYRNPIELTYFKAELLSQMSYSLIMNHETSKAKKACEEAMQLIRPISQIRMPVYLSLFNYMEEAQDWTQLIIEVKRILPKIEMGDSVNNYTYILKNFLAQAYVGLGDYKNAYLYKAQAANLQELLAEKMKVSAAIEIGTVYETSEKDAQILTQKYVIQTQKNRLLILIAILIFFAITLVLIYSNLQLIKQKNKKLFEQISLVSEKEEQLLSLQNTTSENKIFQSIQQLMEDRQLYLKPEIGRKEVANELSTNETYLCTAIREGSGLSFQNYIHKLRLEAARRQLLEANNSATIETIALDCGFNSSRNFHRLFREKFGMTPTEFRKLAHLEN